MAEDAKSLFPFLAQMIFIVSTHGIMTGNTGNLLAGMGIKNFRSHWMGEFALAFMALYAYIIPVTPGHPRIITSMGNMAETAFFHRRMFVLLFLVQLQRGNVTSGADETFLSLEQGLVISGMRGMTVQAAVAIVKGQVTMGGMQFFFCFFMTAQAGFGGILIALAMALHASFCKWFMEHIAHQGFLLTAMGIMTGETVSRLFREILVSCCDLLGCMAAAAQAVSCTFQQQQVVGLMRFVAGGALSFGKGGMDKCIFPCELLVAAEAIPGQIFSQHCFGRCRMREMATGAISLEQGCMHNAPGKLFLLFLVAIVAESVFPFP